MCGMGMRRKWLVLLFGFAAVIALYALSTGEVEPSYQGRTLTDWLAYAGSDDPKVHEAFEHMGTNSIPFLLEWMESKPSAWRERLTLLRRAGQAWIPSLLTSERQNLRRAYSYAPFRMLGSAAEPAIPRLAILARSTDEDICTSACAALAGIGSRSIPILVQILSDTSAPTNTRRTATGHLVRSISNNKSSASLTNNAEIAVLPLVRNLADPDPTIAAEAAYALGVLSLNLDVCIPAMTNALNDTRPERRVAVMNGLCQLNPRPEAVFSIITNAALNDTGRDVRLRAIQGLLRSGDAAVPALRRAIEEPDSAIRFQVMAAFHLAAPAELTNSAMLAIANRTLASPDPGLRRWAISALASFGRDALVKSPDLIATLKDSDAAVRMDAVQAIFRLAPELITNAPPR